jgi:hypothetical protein
VEIGGILRCGAKDKNALRMTENGHPERKWGISAGSEIAEVFATTS